MLQTLTTLLRLLLTTVGALALLITLSYPDTILPPSLDIEYVTELTVYDFKPYMWLLPLLFMELVSIAGKRRNAVWFSGLGIAMLAGVIAWPVLRAHAPEWVERTLPFEDGKLPVGLGYMCLIFFGSILFRLVLLAYLFKEPRPEEDDPTMMDAAVLDPSKARTVREIAANPLQVQPRFLFGEADHALISRFYALVARLRRAKWVQACWVGAAAAGVVAWFFLYPRPTEQQALRRDMDAMLECRRLPDGRWLATRRAVHAAYRVMSYIADHDVFDGMSFEQATKWLRVSRAPEAYRRQLMDRSDISLPSVDDLFESRTRFFTVQDGQHIAVLYIRTDASGEKITIAEVQDAGWNAVMDDRRRRFGRDVSASSLP